MRCRYETKGCLLFLGWQEQQGHSFYTKERILIKVEKMEEELSELRKVKEQMKTMEENKIYHVSIKLPASV